MFAPTLLTILACFAGVFAFAFGMAGFLGLVNWEPSKEKRSLFFFFDQLVAGGVISMLRDIAQNWRSRTTERRMLCLGVACGLLCIILVTLVRRMS